eukprot:1954425-Pyramimonas_sp.AAC.2
MLTRTQRSELISLHSPLCFSLNGEHVRQFVKGRDVLSSVTLMNLRVLSPTTERVLRSLQPFHCSTHHVTPPSEDIEKRRCCPASPSHPAPDACQDAASNVFPAVPSKRVVSIGRKVESINKNVSTSYCRVACYTTKLGREADLCTASSLCESCANR